MVHEDTYLVFLTIFSYIFAFIMLWVGTELKLPWIDLRSPISKKEFLGWWWKVLLLLVGIFLLEARILSAIETLKDMNKFYNIMYSAFWGVSPLLIIYAALMLATISKRTLVLRHGNLIQAITVLLVLVVPPLYEMFLWILYVGLYFLPENKEKISQHKDYTNFENAVV